MANQIRIPPFVNSAHSGTKGLFKHMNYRVSAGGPNAHGRHRILSVIYTSDFVVPAGAINKSYIDEFGPPMSLKRFQKMLRFIDTNIKNYQNKTADGWIKCVDKWSEDADWIIETYGAEHGYVFSD